MRRGASSQCANSARNRCVASSRDSASASACAGPGESNIGRMRQPTSSAAKRSWISCSLGAECVPSTVIAPNGMPSCRSRSMLHATRASVDRPPAVRRTPDATSNDTPSCTDGRAASAAMVRRSASSSFAGQSRTNRHRTRLAQESRAASATLRDVLGAEQQRLSAVPDDRAAHRQCRGAYTKLVIVTYRDQQRTRLEQNMRSVRAWIPRNGGPSRLHPETAIRESGTSEERT